MKQKGIGTPIIVAIIVIVAIAGIGGYLVLKGEVPASAEFEVSNLTFSPSEVEAGEPVIISAMVKNVGDLEGTYTVELKIDGEIQETKGVTLAGGATETVSFTVTKNTSGTYTIGVNGLQRALDVLTPETGNIWVFIWNDDYAYHGLSVLLNGEEIIRNDHFANGYWLGDKSTDFVGNQDQPFEVTGTYELKIKVNWYESGGWTSKTYVETVGDEPAHRYYGVTAMPKGAPDSLYSEGVWNKFYWIVISLEDGVGEYGIARHY